MILTLDYGNTQIKAVVFERFTIVNEFVFLKKEIEENIQKIAQQYPRIQVVLIVSVLFIDDSWFLEQFQDATVHFINAKTPSPLHNKYKTPDTLGLDRWVAACGSVYQFPKSNRLVIDAGSCITYDFIDQSNAYHGGAISPGLQMRYKSIHQFTEKLPQLDISNSHSFIGNSTDQSIHSGIINGVLFEIDGFISSYQEKYMNLTIILTGGDSVFLAKRLKNSIFADKNFIAKSLVAIYYNELSHDKKNNI